MHRDALVHQLQWPRALTHPFRASINPPHVADDEAATDKILCYAPRWFTPQNERTRNGVRFQTSALARVWKKEKKITRKKTMLNFDYYGYLFAVHGDRVLLELKSICFISLYMQIFSSISRVIDHLNTARPSVAHTTHCNSSVTMHGAFRQFVNLYRFHWLFVRFLHSFIVYFSLHERNICLCGNERDNNKKSLLSKEITSHHVRVCIRWIWLIAWLAGWVVGSSIAMVCCDVTKNRP